MFVPSSEPKSPEQTGAHDFRPTEASVIDALTEWQKKNKKVNCKKYIFTDVPHDKKGPMMTVFWFYHYSLVNYKQLLTSLLLSFSKVPRSDIHILVVRNETIFVAVVVLENLVNDHCKDGQGLKYIFASLNKFSFLLTSIFVKFFVFCVLLLCSCWC